ncbi:MAG: citrate synthase [Pseudomonadota bacterium]
MKESNRMAEPSPTPGKRLVSPQAEYLTAADAMDLLGVSAQTLYAYVSRKGLRTKAVPGSRQRLYWKDDIERLLQKKSAAPVDTSFSQNSTITLTTEDDLFYRGQNVAELAEHATLETVACLLWDCDEAATFVDKAPQAPALWPELDRLFKDQSQINRATALFPLLEEANPRAYDLSHAGMARTGADILRWLAAITVNAPLPTTEPIHLAVARNLDLSALGAEMVRRMLVLSADHGFEASVVVVRTLASSGVTPWRALIGGLAVSMGRHTKFSNVDSMGRLIEEIIASNDPRGVIVRRAQIGDELSGFSPGIYPRGDPRARALLAFCAEAFRGDPGYQRVAEALLTVKEIHNREPGFAFVCALSGILCGMGTRASIFQLGRASGWIAHAIEQYQSAELKRQHANYRGPLP